MGELRAVWTPQVRFRRVWWEDRRAEVGWMVLRTGLGGGSEMWCNCSCRTLYHVGVDVPIVLLDSLG